MYLYYKDDLSQTKFIKAGMFSVFSAQVLADSKEFSPEFMIFSIEFLYLK
jgi:hypothetical protein